MDEVGWKGLLSRSGESEQIMLSQLGLGRASGLGWINTAYTDVDWRARYEEGDQSMIDPANGHQTGEQCSLLENANGGLVEAFTNFDRQRGLRW